MPIGMQNASPEPLAAGDAFCIRRWASAEIQACTGGRPYATITDRRDEEMPDDYFNRQQNQHKPRYAAGSDMDSIKTGREIPEGGSSKKKDKSILIAIIAGLILYFWILPQVQSATKQNAQPTGNQQSPQIQADAQGVLHEATTGEVSGEMTSFFYASDASKATIEAHIYNGTNKTISNIAVTFSIVDEAENVLAEKVVEISNDLPSGETADCTTVLETPSRPTGYTQAKMNAQYKIQTF